VSALVRDNTELAEADLRFRVDGRARGFSYDPETDRLSRATGRLSYGRHDVKIVATDGVGNRAVRFWSFRVVEDD